MCVILDVASGSSVPRCVNLLRMAHAALCGGHVKYRYAVYLVCLTSKLRENEDSATTSYFDLQRQGLVQ